MQTSVNTVISQTYVMIQATEDPYDQNLVLVLVIRIFTMSCFILKPSTVGLMVLISTVLAWEVMPSPPSVRLSVSVRPFHSSSSLVFSYV